jgi:hypothetical protein
MADKVDQILNKKETRDSLRYFIISGHDTHILNTLLWLEASNYDDIDAPFSSSIYFEMHYD